MIAYIARNIGNTEKVRTPSPASLPILVVMLYTCRNSSFQHPPFALNPYFVMATHNSVGVLGQLPRLKTYTHVLLAFPLPKDLPLDDLIALLDTAIKHLEETFPWLAYQIVHQNNEPNNSGTFGLAPCTSNKILHIKDHTSTLPPYHTIFSTHGPVRSLPGTILAPVPAFPQIYTDTSLNPAPVFTLQLTLIEGGIFLDVAAQHNVIDGGGLLRLLEHLAKSMRGESFSEEEIEHGNREQSGVVGLLGPEEKMLDHSHLVRESLSVQAPVKRAEARWGFVRIPAEKIAKLKSRANEDVRDDHGTFVSTNDALSAFIWKRIAAVRLAQGVMKHTDSSKFSRALDARRALGLPREYLGQMGFNASCHLTFDQLQDQSLGETALHLRRTAEKVNNAYAVRSWATFIDREPDKSKIMFGGAFNPDTDIGVSSLLHASVSDVDFGVLGKPDLVRRPEFLPLEGCVYLWTQTVRGNVDVLMCLKGRNWEGLEGDGEWKEFTEFIG
jgi:hypothetical protein